MLTNHRIWMLLCVLLLSTGYTSFAQDDDDDDIPYGLSSPTLAHAERFRRYQLYIPETYTGQDAVPLVLVFHGAGGSGENMMIGTEFRDLAELDGSIVVYPDAIGGRWDYLDIPIERGDTVVDDVGFVGALINALSTEYVIDESRIYAIGFSNGGLMAFRARCTLDDRIAAVAMVGASITYQLAQLCIGSSPVATVVSLGTTDGIFPFNGHAEVDDGILYSSFSHSMTVTYLATLNECELRTGRFDDVTAEDSPNRVIVQEPAGCPDDDLIRFYSISEFGHVWPRNQVILYQGERMTVPLAVWNFIHGRSLEADS